MTSLTTPNTFTTTFRGKHNEHSFLAWLRPSWHADALCKEYEHADFFPHRGESSEAAKAVCSRCLVQAECLAFALTEQITHGIWAGTSGRQRLKMMGKRHATP